MRIRYGGLWAVGFVAWERVGKFEWLFIGGRREGGVYEPWTEREALGMITWQGL